MFWKVVGWIRQTSAQGEGHVGSQGAEIRRGGMGGVVGPGGPGKHEKNCFGGKIEITEK